MAAKNKLVNTNAVAAAVKATKALQRVGTHGNTRQSRQALKQLGDATSRINLNAAVNDWLAKNNGNGNGNGT